MPPKMTRLLPALVATALLASPLAQARSSACLDQARDSTEINQCGGSLIATIEEKIELDMKRLNEKYIGNERMQGVLKNTRLVWKDYRNNLCTLEAAATSSGPDPIQPFSLEANKTYFRCLYRKLEEMKTSLEKY